MCMKVSSFLLNLLAWTACVIILFVSIVFLIATPFLVNEPFLAAGSFVVAAGLCIVVMYNSAKKMIEAKIQEKSFISKGEDKS